MKKTFSIPEMEVVRFEGMIATADPVTTSNMKFTPNPTQSKIVSPFGS